MPNYNLSVVKADIYPGISTSACLNEVKYVINLILKYQCDYARADGFYLLHLSDCWLVNGSFKQTVFFSFFQVPRLLSGDVRRGENNFVL